MQTEALTAVLIGGTGATGRHMVEFILDDARYQKLVVLSRRSMQVDHPKLEEHIVDFDKPELWNHLVKGDQLFSALGTTLKLAGSKEAQYKVDVSYQFEVAKAGKQNGVGRLLLISSPNANSRSQSFYLRIKGELEDKMVALGFDDCVFIKPSIIESYRPEGRPGEKIGSLLLNSMCKVVPFLSPYRPISASDLASASINIINGLAPSKEPQVAEVVLGDLFEHV